MQNQHETLGEIIKNARIKADITVEDLAAKVGVGERFIYRIENEGKKPSYDILYKLIRELSILPDQIFFPEKQIEDSEMESLVRMLYNCDERSMQIIKATVRAALDSWRTNGPLVKWLGQRPLTPLTSVRIRYGSPKFSLTKRCLCCTIYAFGFPKAKIYSWC